MGHMWRTSFAQFVYSHRVHSPLYWYNYLFRCMHFVGVIQHSLIGVRIVSCDARYLRFGFNKKTWFFYVNLNYTTSVVYLDSFGQCRWCKSAPWQILWHCAVWKTCFFHPEHVWLYSDHRCYSYACVEWCTYTLTQRCPWQPACAYHCPSRLEITV